MLDSAATLELKARLGELRQRLLRVRANGDKDAGSHSRDNSPNPTGRKHDRLSVSDEDIAALIQDANTTVGSLVGAMNSAPAATVRAAATAETMATGFVFDAELPKTEPPAEAIGYKGTLHDTTDADATDEEAARDLREWLQFTNFYDTTYRKEFLSVHRRAAARRAALEAIEAQRQKLLEEMEQDDQDLAMVQFGAGGPPWARKKLGASHSSPASSATAPHLKQLPAASADREASAAPVSVAPVATTPDTLAAPAAPAQTTPVTPTGPDAPEAPAASPAPASTTPITKAAPDAPPAPASTATVVSAAPDSTSLEPTAPDTPTAPGTTGPVVSVSRTPASPTAPEGQPQEGQPQWVVQFELTVPQRNNNGQKKKPTKRAFDDSLIKEEENGSHTENGRPAKTVRTDKASGNKAQAEAPSKSAATGANGSPAARKPAQSLGETKPSAADKALPDKAQNGLPAKPAAAVTGGANGTRPVKSARQDQIQADKTHANLPANRVPAMLGGIYTEPAAERTSIPQADASNRNGGLKIRGAALNGGDSPAQKSAARFGGRGSGEDGGSTTTNITISGLARATRTADAEDELSTTGASLESRVVRPDKILSPEDVNGKPLHERITKPLSLGRRGDSRFFIIKAFNKTTIRTSMDDGLWVVKIADKGMLTEAFRTYRNVILFFTVNKTNAFQGYARMASRPMDQEPRSAWMKNISWPTSSPFHVEWLNTTTTFFKKVAYLKNPLNDGASVTFGRDGSEIEEECARALMREMDLTRDQGRTDTNTKTSQSWSRGGRSPSYAQDHAPSPYARESEGERAGSENVSPDHGVGYYGNYGGDYGGSYGGSYDSWVPRQNDGSQNSYRSQSWR